MSRTDKFMPLYIADYLGDTSHLGMAEHGAYLLLLCHYWRTQQALPDDDQQLARIARGTRAQWKAVAPIIRAFFKPATINGVRVLVHNRVEREMVEARKRSEAKQAAGKAGGIAARGKSGRKTIPDELQNNSNAINSPLETEWQNNTPSPSPSHSANAEKSISPVPGSKPKPKNLLNGHEKDFNEFWAAYPKRVDKRDAMKAYVKALIRSDASVILAGAQAYAQNRKDEDPQFTKGPAHWLNADCWLDESPLSDDFKPDPELQRLALLESEHEKKR